MKTLMEQLENVKDPRKTNMCDHNLIEIIVIEVLEAWK